MKELLIEKAGFKLEELIKGNFGELKIYETQTQGIIYLSSVERIIYTYEINNSNKLNQEVKNRWQY